MGRDLQQRLNNVTVGMAGLRQVPEGRWYRFWHAMASGLSRLPTRTCSKCTNIQRQIFADEATVGENKAHVTARAIRGINPDIRVKAYDEGITHDNVDDFLQSCDFVHEVMDISALPMKVRLHERARALGIIATTAVMVGTGVSGIAFIPPR